MILSDELKKQFENIEECKVHVVLLKIRNAYHQKNSLILDFYDLDLLFDYICNMQHINYELNEENEELVKIIFSEFMRNRFLELEIKSLRNDKARND